MAVTVLQIAKIVASEIGFVEPSALADANATFTRQLKRTIERTAEDMRKRYQWPECNRDGTVTLVDAQEAYALPGDFESFIGETFWNHSDGLQVRGAIDSQTWQTVKHGFLSSARDLFRVRGANSKEFYITPVPTSGTAGTVLGFEYQSKTWLRPRAWTASAVYSAGTYVSHNGYIFYTPVAGTSGTSAPTPSSLLDGTGGITWTLYTSAYKSITNDADECLLPEDCIVAGTKYFWRQSKGFESREFFQDYLRLMKIAITDKNPGEDLDLTGGSDTFEWPLLPPGGWGI